MTEPVKTLTQENYSQQLSHFCISKWHLANAKTIENPLTALVYSLALKVFSSFLTYGFQSIGCYFGYPIFIASLIFDMFLLINIPEIITRKSTEAIQALDPRPIVHHVQQSIQQKIVEPVREKTAIAYENMQKSESGAQFIEDMSCVKFVLWNSWFDPLKQFFSPSSNTSKECCPHE
ncbi:MAG: hypothetical protein JW769_01655 [Parachlamydiales bacterium]|nr:hypothetical protein [Parachlamydiales bacterium]